MSEIIFRATPENPFHVSVGAVLRDGLGSFLLLKNGDEYSFMCGTINDQETPEGALRRELAEEMGAYCVDRRYMGASVIDATVEKGAPFPYQKTILWFDCLLTSINTKDITDPSGTVCLFEPDKLPLLKKDYGRWPHGLIIPPIKVN